MLPLLGGLAALTMVRALPLTGRWVLVAGALLAALLALFSAGPRALASPHDEAVWGSAHVGEATDWLRLDRDGDGRLDAAELGAAPPGWADRDGDGRLDLSELERAAAARARAWVAVAAPGRRGGLWLPLRLALDPLSAAALLCVALLVFAGALTQAELAPRPGAPALGVLGAALLASLWSASAPLATSAWLAGLAAAVALHQAGSGDGLPLRIGIGSLLTIAAAGLAALSGATLLEGGGLDGAGSEGGAGARWALALGLLLPALALPARPGPAEAWSVGLSGALACQTAAIALLARFAPEGLLASAPLWLALALVLALRAVVRAWGGARVDEVLSGLASASQAAAAAAWSLGAGGAALALSGAFALGLAGLALAADAARPSLGGLELEAWRGLRRLHPRAALAVGLTGLALAGLPGGPVARGLSTLLARALGAEAGWVGVGLGAAALVFALSGVVALRIALRGARGAPRAAGTPLGVAALPAGPPTGSHGALLLAPFALGLWGLTLDPALVSSPWSAPGLVTLAPLGLLVVALGVALLSERRTGSSDLLARLDVRFEAYAPQRRVVQPILGLARRCDALERRLANFSGRALDALGRALWWLAHAPRRAAPATAAAGPIDDRGAASDVHDPGEAAAQRWIEAGALELLLFVILLGALLGLASRVG